jgi:hypothetical protein
MLTSKVNSVRRGIVCAFILLMASIAHLGPTRAQSSLAPRRVNIPYVTTEPDETDWVNSAIFWFGQNKQGVPSQNYVDVRLMYTPQYLRVRATIVDYYLWYLENAQMTDDLTQYDAIAVYLDTNHDRATTPQLDDCMFLIGSHHWPNEDVATYRRQARGTGIGWDATWSGTWLDQESLSWSTNPGPNYNGGLDYGMKAIFNIPWTTLSLSGPPSEGTVWGLGVQLYDRDDQPPAGYVAPEYWPETFDQDNPATWGELHFGPVSHTPPDATAEGMTVIRNISVDDDVTEDAWMGGGGTCSGGHGGGTEVNHGDSGDLFTGSEVAPTHFPCFNKSYLRFSLDAIPSGKAILSATLTLHLFGNAGAPGQAQPSWVHLYTIAEPWDEMTIHWNNAPLAQENVAATWVYPYSRPGDIQWPGDPYSWDATQAVAEAYEREEAVSIALYSSDSAQHSSKYYVSSETGDWNAEGRPTLTVMWGQEPQLTKSAQAAPLPPETVLKPGGAITYTLQVLGSGQALTVTDALPAETSHPLAYTAGYGSIAYDPAERRLTWTGIPTTGQVVTITYPVTVTQGGSYAIINTAHLTAANGSTATASSTVIVEPRQVFLPCVLEQR